MSLITEEIPPVGTDPALSEYLTRLRREINGVLATVRDHEPVYEMPSYEYDGMVVYFGQAIAPDIAHAGIWALIGSTWKEMTPV